MTGADVKGGKLATPSTNATLIDRYLDRAYLTQTLQRLARVPTDVPMGYETFMEPDDPKLVRYVQEVIRPELIDIGRYEIRDAGRNNLVVCAGTGRSGHSVLLQNYTPTQHHNLMKDPLSGEIGTPSEHGVHEPAVYGQGVSQNKAHQAVMLAVLRMLAKADVELTGRLFWAVNNEGRSSHACSEDIIGALDRKPTFGLIQISTGLRISLGNRGRVDVNVHIKGKASHSSAPDAGASAIEGVVELVSRLKTLHWDDQHPILGGRHAVAYKIRFWPLAPHTLPSDAFVTIDRRLIPGDDPDVATQEIRALVSEMPPYEIAVERGVYMLPALVAETEPGVVALQRANRAIRGSAAETFYGRGTFDAGGPCRLGIPTVMYGAGGGVWPLGTDFVPISAVETEARVLAQFILEQLRQDAGPSQPLA